MLPDTLLVDGVDLRSWLGIVVGDLSGLFAPGARRGDDLVVPGLAGSVGTPDLPYAAYSFDVPITVLADDMTGLIDADPTLRRASAITNLRNLAAALNPGLVMLTRRLSAVDLDGITPTTVEHTAAGRFVEGLHLDWITPDTGVGILVFVNLSGCWYDGDTVVVP